jgi:hypothetical protein
VKALLAECHKAYAVSLQMANGEPAKLDRYLRGLVASQDLVAWQGEPAAFDKWLKAQVCDFINRCDVVISPKAPAPESVGAL